MCDEHTALPILTFKWNRWQRIGDGDIVNKEIRLKVGLNVFYLKIVVNLVKKSMWYVEEFEIIIYIYV